MGASSSDSSGLDDDVGENADSTAEVTTSSSDGDGEQNPGEDFATMAHIAVESLKVLVKNAKDDVKKVIEMVVPVLQPLLDAGDVAWRRIRALVARARALYRVYYNNRNNEGGGGGEQGETCEDSTYSDDEALSY